MIRYLHRMLGVYQYHLSLRARRMGRDILLQKTDRELEDMGFSKTLLLAGVNYWPWRLEDEAAVYDGCDTSTASVLGQLNAMNDRELAEPGITRGGRDEAVHYGWADIKRADTESATGQPESVGFNQNTDQERQVA